MRWPFIEKWDLKFLSAKSLKKTISGHKFLDSSGDLGDISEAIICPSLLGENYLDYFVDMPCSGFKFHDHLTQIPSTEVVLVKNSLSFFHSSVYDDIPDWELLTIKGSKTIGGGSLRLV